MAHKLTGRRRTLFLETLAATGNVSAAARAAAVARSTCYRSRQVDPDFAEAWADAAEEAVDQLEAEARRRALEGVERPLVGAGKLIRDDDGKVVMVREYNDRLLEFLLKAHRPEKYRDKPDTGGKTARDATILPAVRIVINGEADTAASALAEDGHGD
jgi:hypothetical protein